MQPLNHGYLTNLRRTSGPRCRARSTTGARYTVPYVVWSDGIGWRNDKIKTDIAEMKVPWDIFWQSPQLKGKVGLLDDYRDGLSMPMQRNAMKAGVIPDLNTEDPAIIAKAGKELEQLTSELNIKVAITDYQTLPEAKTWLHHSWSGDLLGGAFYYMPKGTSPDVLSFWSPDSNGVVQNDFLFVPRNAEKPALAHQFLNFILDEKNAYDNFIQFIGYTPPQTAIDADSLIKKKLIPESLRGALVRPDQFSANQELLALTTDGRQPLGKRLVEVQGGLMQSRWLWRALAFPASRGSRSSSWWRCTRCSRRARKPGHALPTGPVLEPARLEHRLPDRDPPELLGGRAVPDGLHPHVRLRRDRAGPVARDRLPGRLLRRAPRGAAGRASCCSG